jgi:hypothetical protein
MIAKGLKILLPLRKMPDLWVNNITWRKHLAAACPGQGDYAEAAFQSTDGIREDRLSSRGGCFPERLHRGHKSHPAT